MFPRLSSSSQPRTPFPPPAKPKVLPALAVNALASLFPEADRRFLQWAVDHHVRPHSSSSEVLTIEAIVDKVSGKIVDGLGELYPRALVVTPEMKGKERERADHLHLNTRFDDVDEEECIIERLNADLETLAVVFPSHPLPYLRSILSDPLHSPAPLHLSAYTLLYPPPPSLGPPPTLLPHPRSLSRAEPILPPSERIRSQAYKHAVRARLEREYPTISTSSLAALMAEGNHDYRRTRRACEAMLISRSVGARLWGNLTAMAGGRTLFGGGARRMSGKKEKPEGGSSSSLKAKEASFKIKRKKGDSGRDQLDNELWEDAADARLALVELDAEVARKVNWTEYERAGELLECGTCFGEATWEEIGVCQEGHLICRSCINTHVTVLLPSLAFPLPDPLHDDNDEATSSPSAGTLIPCPQSCSVSLPLSTLQAHLTSPNLKAYTHAIDSAFARFLAHLHPGLTAQCPFCPYTVVLPSPTSISSSCRTTSFLHTLLTTLILHPLAFLFLLLFYTLHGPPALPTHLRPSLGPRSLADPLFPFPSPVRLVRTLRTWMESLEKRERLRVEGTIFRCRRVEGEGAGCGRESCRGCGREVWAGEACCDGGGGKMVAHRDTIGELGEGQQESEEERRKESLRLAVEQAMSRAMIRTCPRCELGFLKQDSCNKMTCPRDGYKMCYICRADVSVVGYQHFCPHFREQPGPCRQCTKCDLYLVEREDATLARAAAEARRAWLVENGRGRGRRRGANDEEQDDDDDDDDDDGWVEGMEIGVKGDRERAVERERAWVENVVMRLLWGSIWTGGGGWGGRREVERFVGWAGMALAAMVVGKLAMS